MSEQWEQEWSDRVGLFAGKIGSTEDAVTTALESVIGPKGEGAMEALADPEAATFEDIKTALVDAGIKVPIAILRKNVALLRGPKIEPVVVPEPTPAATPFTGIATDVLPALPDDDSFTAALKVGGELKVGQTEVLAAVRSGLADKVNWFTIPDILKKKMQEFAESNDEPVGAEYYKLRSLIIKRRYSEVLSVLGIEGTFMTEGRKNAFLNGLRDGLWSEVQTFHQQLISWNRSWMESAGNPNILFAAIAGMGGGGGAIPPGMMQPPETDTIRDQAEAVINRINKVFRGEGIPVARALAYDAQQIKDVLANESLPAMIGAANRDQMLKMLGLDVASDYVRMERNVVRYILSVMELPKITSGQSEINFLGALLQLGNSIPWAKLMTEGSGKSRGTKGTRSSGVIGEEE